MVHWLQLKSWSSFGGQILIKDVVIIILVSLRVDGDTTGVIHIVIRLNIQHLQTLKLLVLLQLLQDQSEALVS